MFIRRSRLAVGSVSFVALAMLAAGCAVQTGAPGEGAAGQASEAISYAPLGFARVAATGGISAQFNQAGGVSATHSGTGQYVVSFQGLASGYAGNAQVTAEGAGNERCRLMSWLPSGTNEQVSVWCTRPDGTLADVPFSVAFLRNTFPTATNTFPTEGAYAYVAYNAIQTAYDYNSSGHHNTLSHVATGVYTVGITQATYQNASVMVSAYGGSGAPFCQVGGWTPSSGNTNITVRCWSTTGAAADSAFALWYAPTGPTIDQQGAHAWFQGSLSSSYSAAMARYECGAASVSGSVASNVASVVVRGDLGTWDSNPFRRASFVSGYGYTATYCKSSSLSNVEESSASPATSTSTTQVRCYNAAGTLVAPAFTFAQLTSDASGPC